MGDSKGEALILANLPELAVEGKLSDRSAPGTWRTCTYRAEGVEGVMFGCGAETRPEPATFRLGIEGLYRIWLGLPVFDLENRIRVRLSDDPCYAPFQTPRADYHRPVIHEIPWKEADLTGQDLIVEGHYTPDPHPGFLAYVRLEPIDRLPEKHTAEIDFPMAMTEDGHGVFWFTPHRRKEDLVERYERIGDDTALKIMLWGGALGDQCNYPTKAGEYGFADMVDDYFRPQERNLAENLELWRKNGWDALETARDYCRSRGWEVHFTIRVEAFSMGYPKDEGASQFFLDHPEWWCRDREGRTVARMSYAVPEVQDRMLGIVEELVEYEPDGVGFIFIRGVPMVLYEEEAVSGFREKYGEDPRELSEYDPRWCRYQGEIVNGFVRKAKERLKPGMHLVGVVPGNEFDLRRWGLDVETWVKQGLIDDLYPIGQRFTDHDVHKDAPEALDVEYFHSLEGRENIRLFPLLYPWASFGRDPVAWQNLVRSFKGRGADGYCVWDGTQHEMEKYLYLGVKEREAPEEFPSKVRKIFTLGDYRVDRYHPIEAH